MFLPFWCSKKHATTHLKDQWPCHLFFKLFPVQFNRRDGTCSWVLDATYDTALKNVPLWRTSQLSLWPWGLKRKASPAILHQISVVPDVPPLPHICMHIPTTTSLTHIYTHMHSWVEKDNCHASQSDIKYPSRVVVTFRPSQLMAETHTKNLMELVWHGVEPLFPERDYFVHHSAASSWCLSSWSVINERRQDMV